MRSKNPDEVLYKGWTLCYLHCKSSLTSAFHTFYYFQWKSSLTSVFHTRRKGLQNKIEEKGEESDKAAVRRERFCRPSTF